MEAKALVLSSLIILLFVFSIVGFGIDFAEENNAPVNIINDSRISNIYSASNSTIYNYDDGRNIQEVGNGTATYLDNDDTQGSNFVGDFITSAIIGVAKTTLGFVTAVFDFVLDPILKVVIPSNEGARKAVGIILSVMLISVVALASWRLLKTG